MVEFVVDARELTWEFERLQKHGYNLQAINQAFSQQLHLMVEDKFEQNGPGWPDLSPVTIRRRRRSKEYQMLQDTGDLVNSLQPSAGADYSEVFTNKEYAQYHLNGDGVPKRDFFDIDMGKALELFGMSLLEGIETGA